MADLPVTYEEAVAVAKEIGLSLGGRQQRAIEVLLRYAAKGRKPSSIRLEAVRDASLGAQHFAAARHELDAGLKAVGEAAHKIREAELAEEGLAGDDEKK